MDTKIEIKEEDPLSDDAASQNGRELFTKVVLMKTNSDPVLLDDCNVAIKTEIKSETPFTDFSSQKERECFTKHHIKQIKSETVTSSEIDMKTEIEEQTLVSDFVSQNKREFLPEDKKCNSDHEMDGRIEIKVEPWWLGTETSSICDDTKDGDFLPPVESLRFSMGAVSGDSHVKSLPSAEVSGSETIVYYENDSPDCESQESDAGEIPAVEHIHSEQPCKCNDGKNYSKSLYSNLIHKIKRSYQCNICGKMFKCISDFELHESAHRKERPHMCKTCNKSFTQLSSLKRHSLIHEGNRPHQCKTCDKRFTRLSDLKNHTLIHEGKKPHQCKTCNKSFTDLSTMKRHSLIHEGKKPHQCKTCGKSFTQLSSMKRHSSIHERKVPDRCKTM